MIRAAKRCHQQLLVVAAAISTIEAASPVYASSFCRELINLLHHSAHFDEFKGKQIEEGRWRARIGLLDADKCDIYEFALGDLGVICEFHEMTDQSVISFNALKQEIRSCLPEPTYTLVDKSDGEEPVLQFYELQNGLTGNLMHSAGSTRITIYPPLPH